MINPSDFNLQHKKYPIIKSLGLFYKLWFVWSFMALMGVVSIIYVAIHFLAKFW